MARELVCCKIDTLLTRKSAVVTLTSGSVLWETNRVLAMALALAWEGAICPNMIFGPFTHRLPLVGLGYGRRTWLASVHRARMTPEAGKRERERERERGDEEKKKNWKLQVLSRLPRLCKGEGIAIWPPTQNLAVHMRTSWVGYFLRQAWVCEQASTRDEIRAGRRALGSIWKAWELLFFSFYRCVVDNGAAGDSWQAPDEGRVCGHDIKDTANRARVQAGKKARVPESGGDGHVSRPMAGLKHVRLSVTAVMIGSRGRNDERRYWPWGFSRKILVGLGRHWWAG